MRNTNGVFHAKFKMGMAIVMVQMLDELSFCLEWKTYVVLL